MKAKLTPAEAAAEERRLWMRQIKKWQQDLKSGDLGSRFYFDKLIKYGEGRTKRNKAKEGGL